MLQDFISKTARIDCLLVIVITIELFSYMFRNALIFINATIQFQLE